MTMDILVGGATLALAVGTFWLARETRHMAATTEKMLELEMQPQLAFKAVNMGFDTDAPEGQYAQLAISLWNPGKVLVNYYVNSITGSIDQRTPSADMKLLSRSSVVHPGGEATYFYPPIQLPFSTQSPVAGKLQFDISYWAVIEKQHKVTAALDLTIRLPPRHSCTWLFTRGPEYT